MGQRHSGVDDYIRSAAPFARPLLERLRTMVHAACPDIDEAIRWRAPAFLWRGRMLCSMAAFRAHVAFGFRHPDRVLVERGGDARAGREPAMGQFGRLTRLGELPSQDEMDGWIAAAIEAAQDAPSTGTLPRGKPSSGSSPGDAPARAVKPVPPIPADLAASLAAAPAAQAAFERFAPGQKRDYVEWVEEARRTDTRARRIAQAVQWIAEGKPRNWKYARR